MAKAVRGAVVVVVEAEAAAAEEDDEDHHHRDEHQRPDRAVVDEVVVEAVDDDDDEVESPAVRWAVAAELPRDVSGRRWGCCSCGRRRRWGRPLTSTTMSRMRTTTRRHFDATCAA